MRRISVLVLIFLGVASSAQSQTKPDFARDYDYVRRLSAKSYVFSECRGINNPFTEEETVKSRQLFVAAKKTDETNVIAAADDLWKEVERRHMPDGKKTRQGVVAACKEMLEFALR